MSTPTPPPPPPGGGQPPYGPPLGGGQPPYGPPPGQGGPPQAGQYPGYQQQDWQGQPDSGTSHPHSPKTPRPWYKKKRFAIPLGVLAFFVIVGIFGPKDAEEPGPVAASSPVPSPSISSTKSAEEIAAENQAAEEEAAREAEEEAAREAEEEKKRQEAEEEEAEREATEKAERKAAQKAEKARLDKSSYDEISNRDWALIARDPDAHADRKLVLHGRITQFDSATGTSTFLVSTAATKYSDWWDFDQNTMAVAAGEDASLFADLVAEDLVTMHVEVVSSFSYDTQVGGNTTVPLVRVNIVERYGYAD